MIFEVFGLVLLVCDQKYYVIIMIEERLVILLSVDIGHLRGYCQYL